MQQASHQGRRLAIGVAGIVALLAIVPSSFVLARGSSPDPGFSSPEGPPLAAAISVPVSARVQAVRLIVVDEKGTVTTIWSNTPARDSAAFVLKARQGSLDGQDIPVSGQIRSQYERLATRIDWSVLGKAYSRGS